MIHVLQALNALTLAPAALQHVLQAPTPLAEPQPVHHVHKGQSAQRPTFHRLSVKLAITHQAQVKRRVHNVRLVRNALIKVPQWLVVLAITVLWGMEPVHLVLLGNILEVQDQVVVHHAPEAMNALQLGPQYLLLVILVMLQLKAVAHAHCALVVSEFIYFFSVQDILIG